MNGPEHRWRKRLDDRAAKRRAKRKPTEAEHRKNLLAQLARNNSASMNEIQQQMQSLQQSSQQGNTLGGTYGGNV